MNDLLKLLDTAPFEGWFGWSVTLGQLLIALGVVVGSIVLMRIALFLARRLMTRLGHEDALTGPAVRRTLDGLALVVGLQQAALMIGIDPAAQFEKKIVRLGGEDVTVGMLLVALVMVFVAFVVSRVSQAAMMRSVREGTAQAQANMKTVARLVHYVIMILGLLVALQSVGVQLSAVLAVGGVFMLAIGFAMKTIVENFISGLILMIERAIKVGDTLDVEGMVGRVQELGIRTTIVRTRDGEELIVPNTTIAQSIVKNYTYRDSMFRIRVEVGVTYDSDMRQVRKVLQACADGIEWRIQDVAPVILMKRFGASSVDFEVSVWMNDPWGEAQSRSHLHETIWWALQDQGIVIAFPQLDIHIDDPVVEAVRRAPIDREAA